MLGCVDVHQFHVELILEGIYYLFCFAEAEETVVYKDAGELFADSLMHQHGCYRGIYAAGKGADDVVFANLFADVFHGNVDVVAHGPAAFAFADLEEEILQHGGTFRCVNYFRMELYAEETAGFISHGCGRREIGMTGETKAGGHIGHCIAVAHPYSGLFGNAFKEGAAAVAIKISMAVFMLFRLRYFAAQFLSHELHAVADAQNRYSCFEHAGIHLGCIFCIDTGWTAGENNALRILGKDFLSALVVWQDFAVNAAFADTPCDELGVLAAKVNNHNNFLMFHLFPPVETISVT